MPRGGRRGGAGRPKGHGNRRTARSRIAVSELARAYTPRAIKTLASIMENSSSDQVRVQAACALLDRACGKPAVQLDVAAQSKVEVVYRTVAEFRAALIAEGIPEALLPAVVDDTPATELGSPSNPVGLTDSRNDRTG